MKSLSCPNRHCSPSEKCPRGTIVHLGFYKTRWGKPRRYVCRTCGKIFSSTTGTPYYRLQHRRSTFDRVACLSVEGLNKSAIARVKRIGWNTVHRWLERAAACCRQFNNRKIKSLAIPELQAGRDPNHCGKQGATDLGHRPWLANEATKTRWCCFEMCLGE
jgi:transposase-like protein